MNERNDWLKGLVGSFLHNYSLDKQRIVDMLFLGEARMEQILCLDKQRIYDECVFGEAIKED
jgi:hypothetical protein